MPNNASLWRGKKYSFCFPKVQPKEGCCCHLVVNLRPTLVTPWTVAHQTPLSMGSPRQNTGLGCHFPSSVAKSCPTLLWPHGLQLNRLLCPWDLPDKNTGVGCHFLLQGVFPTQGSNPCLFHCRRIIYHWATREALMHLYTIQNHMHHRCIVHIYKVFDKFYVNSIISFDILSNPGFLSLGTVDIWGWIILSVRSWCVL